MKCVWVMMLLVHSALSEDFKVVTENQVSVYPGYEVVLPCFVEKEGDKTRLNAENMKVEWTRPSTIVHFYENKQDSYSMQSESYKGRTSLSKEDLSKGVVSLTLSNVKDSDIGTYNCAVTSGDETKSGSVDLQVIVIGTQPKIKVTTLLCESRGWSPKPELQWLNSNGGVLTADVTAKEEGNLFSVESSISIDSGDTFHCRVKHKDGVKEEKIKLYEDCVIWIAVTGALAAVFLLAVIVCIIIKAKSK